MPTFIDTPRLLVDWSDRPRPDGRRWKFRRDRRAASIYLQSLRLEVVVWYRNKGGLS